MRNFIIPSKEQLLDLYYRQDKSKQQIATILSMAYGKIHHWMNKYKIVSKLRTKVCGKYIRTKKTREKISKANKGRFKLKNINIKTIKTLYFVHNLTQSEIAKKHNVSNATIRKFFNLYKIKTKSNKNAQKCGVLSPKYGKAYNILKGKDNPNFKGGKPKCTDCGKTLGDYCNIRCWKCYNKWKFGENNPNWKNGSSFHEYSFNFNKELKNKIRIRDNYTCQCCGITEEEHVDKYKKCLTIHHINYNKQNCKENNLITTCVRCNSQANGNRDYWYAFYRYIIDNKLYKEKI